MAEPEKIEFEAYVFSMISHYVIPIPYTAAEQIDKHSLFGKNKGIEVTIKPIKQDKADVAKAR